MRENHRPKGTSAKTTSKEVRLEKELLREPGLARLHLREYVRHIKGLTRAQIEAALRDAEA